MQFKHQSATFLCNNTYVIAGLINIIVHPILFKLRIESTVKAIREHDGYHS